MREVGALRLDDNRPHGWTEQTFGPIQFERPAAPCLDPCGYRGPGRCERGVDCPKNQRGY